MRAPLVMAALLFLAACAPGLTPDQEAFKQACEGNGHMWMLMEPFDAGDKVSRESCWGCMPDMETHICDPAAYALYLQHVPAGMQDRMADGMDDMLMG